jgi:hypothetical protein
VKAGAGGALQKDSLKIERDVERDCIYHDGSEEVGQNNAGSGILT